MRNNVQPVVRGRSHQLRWAAILAVAALFAGLSAGAVVGSPGTASAVSPIAVVPLGTAATFAVLSGAAVGNTAGVGTVLRGDLGAVGAVTGFDQISGAFTDGVYTGTLYSGSAAGPALAALDVAYANAVGRPAGAPLAPDLIGVTVGPGVHTNGAAVSNTGTFTIDAAGDPNAVFIFQIGGAFTAAASSHVVLANGAKASNVFWQVNGAAAIGATSTFAGTVLATAAIGVGANTTFNGRALARTGAISLNSNQFYSSDPTVSITGGASAFTTTMNPTISGVTSVRSPATVAVTVNGETIVSVPGSDGAWSAIPTAPLANGAHAVVASVVDGAGNTGSFTQNLTVDTIAPAVVIYGGLSLTTNDPTPTISGTTDIAPGKVVGVTVVRSSPATTIVGTTLVQSDLGWNLTPSGLSAGTWTVTATVHDDAGNSGNAAQTLAIVTSGPAASIDGGANALTNDSTPDISGQAVGASTVVVSIDGRVLPNVVLTASTWSVAFVGLPVLSNGPHFISMTATDSVNNVTTDIQTLVVDTISPVLTIDPGPTNLTNDTTPTISGTTDVAEGVTVSVTIGGSAPLSALVQAGGTYNATSSTSLIEGSFIVVATVSDPAGNLTSRTQTLDIDTTAPIVTIDGGVSRITADATPTISGSSTGAALGSNVVVNAAGQSMTTSIGAGGMWTVTAASMTNGTHVVSVSVTDQAGNLRRADQSLTINAVAPTITIAGGAVATTSDTTPTILGFTSAGVGSPVGVVLAGQTLNATVQPGGSWNVTAAPLVEGSTSVTATVTDSDGNVGVATQLITIDTVAPVLVILAGFTSVGPKRVFDTREGQSPDAIRPVAKRKVGGAYELQVQLSDLAGIVPAIGVGAVSLNVTSAESTADGFITVYPCGTRELVSSLNFTAGRDVANAVITPVSASGAVCFYASAPTEIIADIDGWFAVGSSFTSVGPKRVFDTRSGQSADALRSVVKAKIPAGGIIEVRVTGIAGLVPDDGVSSVSLDVVVTDPDAAGFITVYSCGDRTLVSSVNYVAGQTVANAVIAPVSTSGTVCFYSLAGTNLVVDINGWFHAGPGFTAIGPARLLDTRAGNSPNALRDVPKMKVGGGYILEVKITDLAGLVPASGVMAISMNLTATNPDSGGYVTVFACGKMEEVSSLNFASDSTVANAVITPVSAAGTVCLFSNVQTDVVVDINGWIGTSIIT